MTKSLINLVAMAALLVATAARAETAASLELRGEAALLGDAVRLKNIARWPQADNGFFQELGDLTVARFVPEQRELTIDLATVRTLLEGAGVNETQVSLRGPTTVRVRRLDVDAPYAKIVKEEKPKTTEAFLAQKPKEIAAKPAEAIDEVLPPSTENIASGQSLRGALASFLSDRINIPVEDLEISFPSTFDKLLDLTGPTYTWRINMFRNARLGAVTFKVMLQNGTSNREVEISGNAKAWRQELRMARPVSMGQVLREGDVEFKRVLVSTMPERMPIKLEFALTMQATRDIWPGDLVTMQMLKPVLLVKRDEYITLTAGTGNVQVTYVGVAKSDGVYGQPVKVQLGDAKDKREIVATISGLNEARIGLIGNKAEVGVK